MAEEKLKNMLRDFMGDLEVHSKKDKYSYAKSFKTGLPTREVKRRGIKPYIFNARVGRDGKLEKKYFKTRKESDMALVDFIKNNKEIF